MASQTLRRRSGAAAAIYVSAVAGFLGQLLAARALGPSRFGALAIVLSTASFFQTLLDLTAEEAVIKYGFRYTTGEAWGQLRRLFQSALAFKVVGGLVAGVALLGAGLVSSSLRLPFLIAAFLPIAQAPEGLAGIPLLLRGRYDVRSAFLSLGMALRLGALVVGSRYGVWQTMLGVAAAQLVSTAAVSAAGWITFHRFPKAAAEPLGPDRREIFRFIVQSSVTTGVLSLRGTLTPILLGIVSGRVQVGLFRVAQAPQTGLSVLSAPIRIIQLTELTASWEEGRTASVFASIRRYSLGALAVNLVLLPPLLVFMDDIVRLVYGSRYAAAATAMRLIVVSAALHFVTGWTKTLPVAVGRPGLRTATHAVETIVLLPLVLALGIPFGASGAAAATAVASAVFVCIWAAIVLRLSREQRARLGALTPTIAESVLAHESEDPVRT